VEDYPLDDSDSGLVERARSGDVAAYEAIVRRYQDVAFRVAYTIVGSAEEAEDAAQEGFIRAYRAIHRFRPGAPLRPWLLTIIANAARTRRTAAARRPALVPDWSSIDAQADPAPAPEAAALSRELQREILTAVESLREDDRRVIASRYFLGLSESETAAVLGCARGTVKSRQSRALGRLRQQMQSNATVANRTSDG
jgi:RNA polymerase sigma factor (sigma-70 family)